MRLLFVYYFMDDAGSAQDVHNYMRVAKAFGHEVVVYGPAEAHSTFRLSRDLASTDAVIFIFEWTTQLRMETVSISRGWWARYPGAALCHRLRRRLQRGDLGRG